MNREDMLIEAKDLIAQLDNPKLRIYDASILFNRKEEEPTAFESYQEKHIAGAAFFDHDAFSDANNKYRYMALAEAELGKQIGKIGISEDSHVVFYTSEMLPCATRAWWLLRYAGHNNVRVLNGGLAAWEKAGGKLEQGACVYEEAKFEGQLRSDMFASKEDVLAAMQDGSVCTVHTLSADIYEKAHIKDSSLLPFSDLIDETASFLTNDVLAQRLKEEAQHERVITYCGGGIAATLNAMAHLMAGNQNVAVYDGSMSEWTGEGLPISKSELS